MPEIGIGVGIPIAIPISIGVRRQSAASEWSQAVRIIAAVCAGNRRCDVLPAARRRRIGLRPVPIQSGVRFVPIGRPVL